MKSKQDKTQDDLAPKQAAFVVEFMKDRHGTHAAVRAGYAKRGAHVAASRMLKNPKIKSALAKAQESVHSEAIMTYTEMCETLSKMARDDDARTFDRQRAMDQLSKLKGYNAPTKVAPTDPSGQNPYAAVTPGDLAAFVAALPGLTK